MMKVLKIVHVIFFARGAPNLFPHASFVTPTFVSRRGRRFYLYFNLNLISYLISLSFFDNYH